MTNTNNSQKKSGKNTWNPFNVCLVVTLIAIVGALIAISSRNPLWMFVFMLPTVIYEVIRTEEGASTKFSSILLLVLIVLELILIVFGVNYNLASFFDESEKVVAGYTLPLGDIKVFGPLLTAILSTILVFRTYGPYTRWLSVIIAVGSLVAVFLISPNFFQQALKLIVNGLFDRLYSAF
jgi:hypothetical protein